MAQVNKLDSNSTALRIAEELSLKTLPGTPVWIPYEPNSYGDFGGQVSTVARNPINANRQRKKGVVTDLDASGNFNTDLTQANLRSLLQGFFFADVREKRVPTATTAVNGAGVYSTTVTTGVFVGSLVFMAGFTNAANNGFKVVTAVAANTSITVSGTTVVEASPPATATITVVGYRTETAADLKIDVSGAWPALTSTTKNLTQLGLIVGEWVFIGGDAAANQFANATNNGFKRVKTIATNRIEFDKSDATMVVDAAAGKSVDIYVGRVLRNETGTLIKRRTYQLERTLGAPDDAQPTQIQSEYLVGAVANELTFNIPTADKLNVDLGFIGLTTEQRDGVTGVKSGTRPALTESDAFNTSSDFSRMRMAIVSSNPAPTPLFGYVTEAAVSIKNNATAAKAVGVLGGFDINLGTFEVGGSVTAYFSNISAINAVRNNSNVSIDLALVKNNAGIVIDIPLLALGDARAAVEQDQPITLPLEMMAASAALIDPNADYTLLMNFFDYLPTLADV